MSSKGRSRSKKRESKREHKEHKEHKKVSDDANLKSVFKLYDTR